MRVSAILGVVLIGLGVIILFFLRDILISLILLALELVGVFIGLVLIIIGVGLLFGGWWIRRFAYRGAVALISGSTVAALPA